MKLSLIGLTLLISGTSFAGEFDMNKAIESFNYNTSIKQEIEFQLEKYSDCTLGKLSTIVLADSGESDKIKGVSHRETLVLINQAILCPTLQYGAIGNVLGRVLHTAVPNSPQEYSADRVILKKSIR